MSVGYKAGAAVMNQGSNLPALFANNFDDQEGTLPSRRITKETYLKLYAKCVRADIADSKYTLSYALDGAPAKVVGSTFTSTSNPFILVEGLADGTHTITVTCKENAKSSVLTPTLPLLDSADSKPLVLTWMVDTATSLDVKFDSATPDVYTNSKSTVLTFSGDIVYNANYHSLAWMCKKNDAAYAACGSVNVAATTTTVAQCPTVNGAEKCDSDGKYSFKAKLMATFTTNCAGLTSTNFCTDLSPREGVKGTSWILDLTAPMLAITSTPAAKSQYTHGKAAKFEFACKSGEVSCSYFCSFDGFATDDASDSDKTKGFFKCHSPLMLSVMNSTTHSFKAYAVDAAGNASPNSDLHMFYSDGTGPTVEFTYMDTTTTAAAQLLATGTLYYALDNDVTITGTAMTKLDGSSANNFIPTDDAEMPFTTSAGVAGIGVSARSDYNTVLQFPYDPSKAVYELDGTYGAILAMKAVNGLFYYNVLDTTNADFGTLNFKCIHSEMA
eukprot:CAMPEP_0198198750 /NCGR_PEP_ID=MMETSP1445-20131203/2154_1 /TAXON_ID=36898 /ORGANISM="Pyramimonas sp., Strain CCMP2087" /LENGTH=498 /DNA_ID=CAMNT_0043868387 /DNA_START=161 /DNA_END=1657 /DNA_ORIENTATION=-